jgi:hypothetical protein
MKIKIKLVVGLQRKVAAMFKSKFRFGKRICRILLFKKRQAS